MRYFWMAVICVFAMAAAGGAAEKPATVPDEGKFLGGAYTIVSDSMVVSTEFACANNRETIVGNYLNDPKLGGERRLNMDQVKDLTDRARELRERLLAVKTRSTDLFAFSAVIVGYDQIVIVKYPRREWSEFMPQIEAVFKETAKKK
jgi:hypothetical protein